MDIAYFDRKTTLLDTSIVISTPSVTIWATPYFFNLPPLFAGDLIQFVGEQEIEVPVSYNTEIASQIILSPGWCPNNLDAISPTGFIPGPIIGSDLSSNPMHYADKSRNAMLQLVADMPTACAQFRFRARSSSATGNDTAIIKPGQGHFSVLVLRP